MTERLFDVPLSNDQLDAVRRQLHETLQALRKCSASQNIL